MGQKLCPKIILEGTRLTHKTEVAFALNEHPRIVGPRRYRYHSPVVSAEWCAFTNFPWGRGLINFEQHEENKARETYATWVRLFELLRYYSWIIDRFHLSTRVHQRLAFGRDFDARWIEERLRPLGFHIAVLTRAPASFAAARAERVKVSGKPSQYDDLRPFFLEQEEFLREVRTSLLPWRQFDISDGNAGRVVEEIADWMEETGGLWMKDA
jgi:hypothetical protein